MQLRITYVCLLTGLFMRGQSCWGQSRTPAGQPKFVTQAAGYSLAVCADSMRRVWDSLEINLLRISQTYQQLDRLLLRLPTTSVYLDSLPSVLPVDLPIEEFRVSSPFGLRHHPVYQRVRPHRGLDVVAAVGMIVKATAPGLVVQTGYDPQLGAFVCLQHAFGFETTYGHLSGYCVRTGQLVARSEQIGRVGSTGLTTGPHLHYTIKKNGSINDPFQFCFLLRRRLWLYKASKEAASANSELAPASSLSSKGSYPSSRN